jgi:NOL1/NOP2/fmu family ribosome biogenesis protein
MKPLSSSQKKKIIQQLEDQFGINSLPYLFLQFGKDKIRIYSGNLSKENLNNLDKNTRIENMGLYFARIQTDGIRLTIDGIQLVKNQITKNIMEINDDQAEDWFKGNDLDIKAESAFKILKNNNEFIGCGKSTGDRITNFVPKERRIKN